MSHEERNTWISVALWFAINGYAVYRLMGLSDAGALAEENAVQVVAKLFLWVIGVGVAVSILSTIVTTSGAAFASRWFPGANVVDERDSLFEMRGMAATMFFAVIGFIAMIAALAWGVRPVTGLMIIYFAFAGASLFGDIVRLFSYRAGI